ncbi:MAG: hypothetical protein BM565_13695, partial [Gammaproteobacteria bacterium MedPE]
MARAANHYGLLNIVVEHDLLSSEQAQAAAANCASQNKPFLTFLIENQLVNSSSIAKICCQEFSTPLFDLTSYDINQLPADLLNEKRIIQHSALPLFVRGSRLYVAIGDPTNNSALEEFQFNAGMRTEAILVCEKQLQDTILKVFESDSNALAISDFDE